MGGQLFRRRDRLLRLGLDLKTLHVEFLDSVVVLLGASFAEPAVLERRVGSRRQRVYTDWQPGAKMEIPVYLYALRLQVFLAVEGKLP